MLNLLQLLKSEVATVEIPEMEFEIPGSLVDCRHLTVSFSPAS